MVNIRLKSYFFTDQRKLLVWIKKSVAGGSNLDNLTRYDARNTDFGPNLVIIQSHHAQVKKKKYHTFFSLKKIRVPPQSTLMLTIGLDTPVNRLRAVCRAAV